ncbi:MAG: metal ABC transporter permease, partial [Gemmataceae bacterium]|nr:metal ABC transporter permease [Gemmataceae bacterium]
MDALVGLLDTFIEWVRNSAPEGTYFNHLFAIKGFLAVVLVCLICGAIGGQVVGNRMAFFSDALAHCAFAGFAVAAACFLAFGRTESDLRDWMMPIMVAFGVGIGLLIAVVRETTGLQSDTVIGVFFAGAIGLGAVFLRAVKAPGFDIESFIFGDTQKVRTHDIAALLVLLTATLVFFALFYNRLVLVHVNPSLALSRGVSVRLCQYLFVVLLGLVVNLCLFVVGTLLINALLIVPAATAAN